MENRIQSAHNQGPTVVFDHGCGQGSSALLWSLVTSEVCTFANTFAYDRAGYGWSELGNGPHTNEQAVDLLYHLLRESNVPAPYILVGHSYGGINVRLFADKYPQIVAGIVLVDATHEDELTGRFPKSHVNGQIWGKRLFGMLAFLAKFGVLRPVSKSAPVQAMIRRYPEELQPMISETFVRMETAKAVYREFASLHMGYDRVRGQKLGDLPLTVIKAGGHTTEGDQQNHNSLKKSDKFAVEQALYDVAVEMSRLSTQGKLIIAEKSGHYVHADQPYIVVQAVRNMLNTLRL